MAFQIILKDDSSALYDVSLKFHVVKECVFAKKFKAYHSVSTSINKNISYIESLYIYIYRERERDR